jgi:signal transduction histidine kinase
MGRNLNFLSNWLLCFCSDLVDTGNPEGKMSDGNPDLLRLAELTGGLRLHEHLCLIYNTQEQHFAAALPYLKAGLQRRERCLYIADENDAAIIQHALRKAGVDVEDCIRTRDLIITVKQETYLKQEPFDPDWMIGFLTDATAEATAAGFSGLRVLGEMIWMIGTRMTADKLIEYESKLNRFVRDHDARVVCQYCGNRFSPELKLGVIRTHPVVVYGGIVCKNPYYVPSDELLDPNQTTREVGRLLGNILRWENSVSQLRALAAGLQTAREEERARAARDIHDELGYALVAIKLELTALLRDLPAADEGPARQRSQSILKLLDEAIQSIRRIATELRPAVLDDLGVVAAVEWLAEDFQARTGTEIQLSLPEVELAIDRERATALFRILQEALTNVTRHANATQVNVRLAEEDGIVTLEIHDNGRGITEEQRSAINSLGILGMQERSLLLGGELNISSVPGSGTTVTVRIPQA